MAFTITEKMKIIKYLKEHAIDDIYYQELCDILNRKGKIKEGEFIDFFTNYIIDQFLKSDKISIKQLSKSTLIIQNMLISAHEDNIEISSELLDKICNFKDLYQEYLDRTKDNIDSEFQEGIDLIIKNVNEYYPGRETGEKVAKYINNIKVLEDQIKRLQNENIKLSDQISSSQIVDEKRQKTIKSLSNKFAEETAKTNKLNQNVFDLNKQITLLESELSRIQAENKSLKSYKDNYEMMVPENEELRKKVQEATATHTTIITAQQQALELKEKQSDIENLIYKKLLFEKANVDEILEYVISEGYVSNKEEVSSLLKNVRSRISIANRSISILPSYEVVKPRLSENTSFSIDIPKNCKHYDIMLVSDFHIENFSNTILRKLDMLNNYCVKNDIHLILNLGDFYDGLPQYRFNWKNVSKMIEIIQKSASLVPKTEGLYHAILGGNHDITIAKCGFDPIEMLASERDDIINLGYTHSTIKLNGEQQTLGKFDIHHPGTFYTKIDIDDNGLNTDALNGYLNGIYTKQGRNRNDSYIDIFGHTHKSQINFLESYCYIPSYFNNGANHLRLYFDESGIKYSVFMPLSINNELEKNNEIFYQKVLK